MTTSSSTWPVAMASRTSSNCDHQTIMLACRFRSCSPKTPRHKSAISTHLSSRTQENVHDQQT